MNVTPTNGLTGLPDQTCEGEWTPAPDQPVDAAGRPRPVPPPPAAAPGDDETPVEDA